MGTYILLTQHVRAEVQGLHGLAISLTAATVITTPFGAVAALLGIAVPVAVTTVTVAIVSPLVPFALEMVALRRCLCPRSAS